MTATRPVTTPNFHFSPPCAKPADHHDTPHKDGRLFNAAHTKRTTPRPQTPHRGQGSIATTTTRATCDVRAVRAVCIGRGGVVAAQCRWSSTAGWGRICFRRSRTGTAPFRVAITTALFAKSRFFHACFFRVMLWVRGRPAACAVYVADRPRGMTPDAASERRWRRDASLPPIL